MAVTTFIRLHQRDRMWEIYRNNQLFGIASSMSEARDVEEEAREFKHVRSGHSSKV